MSPRAKRHMLHDVAPGRAEIIRIPGHPDHRLVSAVVTQLAQQGAHPALYYAALPKSGMPESMAELRFPAAFAPTADEYLNARVRYSAKDEANAREALTCHQSQFTPASMERINALTEKINRGTAYLRW